MLEPSGLQPDAPGDWLAGERRAEVARRGGGSGGAEVRGDSGDTGLGMAWGEKAAVGSTGHSTGRHRPWGTPGKPGTARGGQRP